MSFHQDDHRDYREPLSQGGSTVWHCKACGNLCNGKDDYCEECRQLKKENTELKPKITVNEFLDSVMPTLED